jgi:hypothetical protein
MPREGATEEAVLLAGAMTSPTPPQGGRSRLFVVLAAGVSLLGLLAVAGGGGWGWRMPSLIAGLGFRGLGADPAGETPVTMMAGVKGRHARWRGGGDGSRRGAGPTVSSRLSALGAAAFLDSKHGLT